MAATEKSLKAIQACVVAGKLNGADAIGVRVGKVVNQYKVAKHFALALANLECAFRSLTTVDLKVQPIHHRTADRVRAHILLCMLAYYVEWHMREAWRALTFADTEQAAKATRDPVAPAPRSEPALDKVTRHTLGNGTPAHSFSTLMAELGSIVRNTCRTSSAGPDAPTFDIVTTPSATQRHVLDLIKQIRP